MRENRISILINKSVNDVYRFTIDPINTPRWIENIKFEETDEWPIKIGTIYKNINTGDKESVYVVCAFQKNRLFELVSRNGGYHVRYIYKQIESDITEMVYYEWVDYGELEEPFTQSVLEKLKSVMESS